MRAARRSSDFFTSSDVVVVAADALGGDVERLGDGRRIGAFLDGLLERVGRVRVVGPGDEQIDELP